MSHPDAGPTDSDPHLVTALFAAHGIREPWSPLLATGVANRIYATSDVVLRVATDYPDAVDDARTESVAAPAARAAGIRTPRLIAFDDSRTLVDRPYSLWERVHGETLGLLTLDEHRMAGAWREVGRELARLHERVTTCPDPDNYLDTPGRPLDLETPLGHLARAGLVDRGTTAEATSLIRELAAYVATPVDTRFIHDDIHAMNVMCSADGALLALIDWGDAGWGDPTLDFVAIPLDMIDHALEGYHSETPSALGDHPAARFIWDKLHYAMRRALDEGPGGSLPLEEYWRFLEERV